MKLFSIQITTIDRIDNNRGHELNNVVPCCMRCQFIRRDMPLAAFEYLVPYIKEAEKLGLFGNWDGRTQRFDMTNI